MAYLGGKSKGAAHILKILNDPIFHGFAFVEPFVGMAHILRRVVNKRSYTASDGSLLLIELLLNIQKNGDNCTVNEETYKALKTAYFDGTLVKGQRLAAAYAAYTHSFMGVMFGGYCVASGKRRYVEERLRYYDHLRQNATFAAASLSCFDYRDLEAHTKLDETTLVYCDPPYDNGCRHASAPSASGQFTYGTTFDSEHFWDFVRTLSAKGVSVIVSEYEAPPDFLLLASSTKTQTTGRGKRRLMNENVYAHESSWFASQFVK